MATKAGTGTIITFGGTSYTAEVVGVSWGGISKEAIDTTHLGSTAARSFIPGELYDPGELSLDLHLQTGLPPVVTSTATETITVEWGNDSVAWAATGFMTSFEAAAPLEDKMTATATVKFSGAITTSTGV